MHTVSERKRERENFTLEERLGRSKIGLPQLQAAELFVCGYRAAPSCELIICIYVYVCVSVQYTFFGNSPPNSVHPQTHTSRACKRASFMRFETIKHYLSLFYSRIIRFSYLSKTWIFIQPLSSIRYSC